ncbi:hypothetical protein [Paracoccus aminophilus]|uniref:Uncharacterized protein n=1 Tax=Paracoccus aminophilus JCM 7686 TaxID=1367847 RepID=S5YB15_PARAH|nr:hypothetical protein [Paracoccus aminophilus]AGT08608.1 hypothetical protein JCM7686_1507 [Paracoccus aminophilus JCM 7686]
MSDGKAQPNGTTSAQTTASGGVPHHVITGKEVARNWVIFFAGMAALMTGSYWLFS